MALDLDPISAGQSRALPFYALVYFTEILQINSTEISGTFKFTKPTELLHATPNVRYISIKYTPGSDALHDQNQNPLEKEFYAK